MLTEREELIREINGLKESIRVAWTDMVSKPMAPAERKELRQSPGALVHDLNNLRTKLDQLSKAQA